MAIPLARPRDLHSSQQSPLRARSPFPFFLLLCIPLVLLVACSPGQDTATSDAGLEVDGEAVECTLDINEYDPCYLGPEGSQDVGACHAGGRLCQDGSWTECRYQTLPSAELCNQIDDDCNGTIDDQLQDACGHCQPAPSQAARCVGTGCLQPLPHPEGSECADACCNCLVLTDFQESVVFHQTFFLCDWDGLCAEAGESDRGWDRFLVDAQLTGDASIHMRFRAATTEGQLGSATWHEAIVDVSEPSLFRFGDPEAFAEYVEIEVTLRASQGSLQLCQLRAEPVQFI